MKEYWVTSIAEYIECISKITSDWIKSANIRPWFRGHTNYSYLLIPSILRDGNENKEFEITREFRLRAPGYCDAPDRDRIDQWLFLMQHYEAPTRLLDWTESPLFAAYFATRKAISKKNEIENDASVFVLDPLTLNMNYNVNGFPNTWARKSGVLQTIKFAFGTENELVEGEKIQFLEDPVAIHPVCVDQRIKVQKSCFTLHGNDKRDIAAIFEGKKLINENRLFRISILKENIRKIFNELDLLGITESVVYPSLDGLSNEIKYRYGI
jgi:hypothetical protein